MANNKFSVTAAVKYGLYTAVEKILFFLGVDLLLFALFVASALLFFFIFIGFLAETSSLTILTQLSISPSAQQEIINRLRDIFNQVALGPVLLMACLVLSGALTSFISDYLLLGFVRVTLDIHDHKVGSFKRLFCSIGMGFKAFVTSILYHFLIGLGTLCLIVPGIIIGVRCSLYRQLIVDEDAGIIESLKESARITKGSFFKLFGIGVIFWLLNCLMVFTFGLIALITYPAFYLTQAYVYRKLLD